VIERDGGDGAEHGEVHAGERCQQGRRGCLGRDEPAHWGAEGDLVRMYDPSVFVSDPLVTLDRLRVSPRAFLNLIL